MTSASPVARSRLTEQFFRTVGRHFVSLSCVQTSLAGKDQKLFIFSGFLIEAGGLWFYVTAGHILRDIRTSIESGATFDVWRLGDQSAGHRFGDAAIPYGFDLDRWLVVEDSEVGLDYATVALEDIYCRQLRAGGCVPIGKDAWGTHMEPHDFWALVGIPSETVEYDNQTMVSGRIVIMPLEVAEAPEMAGRTAENKFFAHIVDAGVVTDVNGMSGGPIFSLAKVDDAWRYKVIGVQSSWYRHDRVVAACPIASLGLELEKLVEQARDSLGKT
jgi:hypothetical protein